MDETGAYYTVISNNEVLPMKYMNFYMNIWIMNSYILYEFYMNIWIMNYYLWNNENSNSEVSQKEKHQYRILTHIYGI